jgi:hypothetical protein
LKTEQTSTCSRFIGFAEAKSKLRLRIAKKHILYAAGYFNKHLNFLLVHASEDYARILNDRLLEKYADNAKCWDPKSNSQPFIITFPNQAKKDLKFYVKSFFDKMQKKSKPGGSRFELLTENKIKELLALFKVETCFQ